MTNHRTAEALRQLGDAARASGLADAALLAQFAAARDQSAFAELVRRHGPLVLGVCRRVTGHRHDAEDAFQATFLILASKAEALGDPGRLANWLYGVAYRVARKARRAVARRRAREVQVATFPDPHAATVEPAPELGPILDAALAGLPEVYRSAVVLCDLQQKSRAEAAALLGVPEGTLSSRLAAGRKKLADRLARRGVVVSIMTLSAILAERSTAAVPGDLTARTVEAVAGWAAGEAVATKLRYLMSDGGPVMWKATGVIAAAVAAVGLAVGAAAAWPGANPEQTKKPVTKAEPLAKAADAGEKPAKGTKPRLMTMANLEASTSKPMWNEDGTAIAVVAGQLVQVFDGKTLKLATRYAAGETGAIIGFTHDKPAFISYFTGPRRINSVTQLRSWSYDVRWQGVFVERPNHSVDLDPADGTPFAISTDGNTVLTVGYDRRQKAADEASVVVASRYRVLDAGTGDVVRELASVAGYITGHAASPDGRRLVVVSQSERGQLVAECLDTETGKKLWDRPFAERADPREWRADAVSVVVSPDGKRVAVTLPDTETVRPGSSGGFPVGGRGGNQFGPKGQRQVQTVGRVYLMDMTDGGPFHPPEGTTDESWSALGFSHDGKLFVARSGAGRTDSLLRVWDVRSGKVVKTWEGSADAAFAPDRPALAVLEHYLEYDGDAGTGRPRGVNKATLGLWDLSPLVK